MPYPQLVIYDLDGTLVDSVPDIALSLNLALEDTIGKTTETEQVRQWVGNGSLKLVARGLEFFDQDIALLEQTHERFLWHYSRHLNSASQLYPGTRQMLADFAKRGIPQVIATNKPQQFVPAIIQGLGVQQYFKAIVGGNTFAERKPSPLPLQRLCKQFACKPENALMVGDSLSDAKSAQAAGIPCWLLEQGYAQGLDLHQLGAQKVFKDTQELVGSLLA